MSLLVGRVSLLVGWGGGSLLVGWGGVLTSGVGREVLTSGVRFITGVGEGSPY